MRWFTKSNGQLVLATHYPDQFSKFEVATGLYIDQSIDEPLTLEHVKTIGSYPEDWRQDSRIGEKINAAARLIFSSDCYPIATCR